MAIKARDIRSTLKGKIDPQLLITLEAMVEEQQVLKEKTYQLAVMLDRMMEIQNTMVDVAGEMKTATDMLNGKDSEQEGHTP